MVKKNSSKRIKKDITEAIFDDSLSNPSYEQFCVENKKIDKNNYRITLKSLETLWKKSLDIKKKPCLILGFIRDNNEIFLLQCFLTIKKNKKGWQNY